MRVIRTLSQYLKAELTFKELNQYLPQLIQHRRFDIENRQPAFHEKGAFGPFDIELNAQHNTHEEVLNTLITLTITATETNEYEHAHLLYTAFQAAERDEQNDAIEQYGKWLATQPYHVFCHACDIIDNRTEQRIRWYKLRTDQV